MNRKFKIKISLVRNMFNMSNLDFCMAEETSEVNDYV